MNFLVWSVATVGVAVSSITVQAAERPQHVIISFDGAHDNAQWERSLKLADETGARFTYFLSCVYLLGKGERALYKAPGMRAGRSNVGFAASPNDAQSRLGHVWAAYQAGHEIASHGCGHFDGGKWSASDWEEEFAAFSDILSRGWTLNGEATPAGWSSLVRSVRGFRAPYLSVGPGLSDAIDKAGLDYDASTVSRGPAAPGSNGAHTTFALPMIPEGPSARRIIAMDYNLFVRHSGGIERPSGADDFADRAYTAFAAALDAEMAAQRRPLQIGFHFTLMNGGAYWNALERFVRTYCPMERIRCISYSDWLDERAADARAIPDVGG